MVQSSSNVYHRDEAALNLISQLMEQNKDSQENINLISDRLDTLENKKQSASSITLTNVTTGDLIKYDGSNFINFAPTYLDGAGIPDNYLIKLVSGVTTRTTFIETSTLDVGTSLNTYIPTTSGLGILGGSIETEIFDTSKRRMHLTSGGIAATKGITITTDGRVGIGLVEPEEDLEIDGSIQIDSANVARLKFKKSGQNSHALSEIDGEEDGTNGGDLQFYTKVDGASLTEKLRINNQGAFGIEGANFGTAGQVLTSNDSGNAVSWENQTDTTYTNGTGVSINGSNQISIGQSVGITNDVEFANVKCSESLVRSVRSSWVPNYNVYDRRSYPYFLIGPAGPHTVHSLLNGRINAETIQGLGDTVEINSEVVIQRCNTGLLEGSTRNQFSSQQSYIVVKANGNPYNFYGSHYYNPVSDDRLKHNEEHLTNCLDTIRKLKPQKYQKTDEMKDADYNGELEDGTWVYEAGLIAQEVMEIPELNWCVNGGGLGRRLPTDPETEQPYIVGYSNILMYHLQATKELDTLVQQQQVVIQQQQTVIQNLVSRIEALESK